MATGGRWLILFAISFAALSFQKVVAQEEPPPLDKTIEWLRAHTTNSIVPNQQISDKKSSKQQITEWTFDNPSKCTLVWKAWKPEEKAGRGEFISVEIHLADFDPQRISTGRYTFSDLKRTDTFWTVFLEAADKKSVVNWHSSNGSSYSPSISFRYDDEDVADGVGRAFQHAINLCGGKSSSDKPDPFIRRKKPLLPPHF